MGGELNQADGQMLDEVAAAEAAPAFPTAYAARVRAAVRRLDPLPAGPMDVPQALELVVHQSRIDVDVPLRSQRRSAKVAKVAIKRATAWYLRYLADQVGDLGQSLAHLGMALAQRVDAVAADVAEERSATATELAQLRRRVTALETAGPGKRQAKTLKADKAEAPEVPKPSAPAP